MKPDIAAYIGTGPDSAVLGAAVAFLNLSAHTPVRKWLAVPVIVSGLFES